MVKARVETRALTDRPRKGSCVFMKKVGCIILTLLMLLPCAVQTAWAQTPSPIVLEATMAEEEAGETVSLTVRIATNPGITSLKLSLSYDSSVLTLKNAESSSLLDGWYQASPTAETHPYIMVWVASEIQNKTGDLIVLDFLIEKNATLGTTTTPTLTVEEAFCNGSEIPGQPIELSVRVICKHEYEVCTPIDGQTHRKECSKCHDVAVSDHVWDEGSVTTPATSTSAGEKIYTCTDCKATRTEVIPMLPADGGGVGLPMLPADEGGMGIPIIIGCVAVAIAVMVVLIIILLRKKRRPMPIKPLADKINPDADGHSADQEKESGEQEERKQ